MRQVWMLSLLFTASLLLSSSRAAELPELEIPAELTEPAPSSAPFQLPEIKPLPGDFAPDGMTYRDPVATVAYRLQLSSFLGYFVEDRALNVGLGIGYGEPTGRWRTALQVSPDRAGVAATLIVLPGIDFGVGISYTRNFKTEKWTPGLHVTAYSW